MAIDCTEFCRALADGTRQRILEMLLEREMCVGDIADAFNMSQPSISHHLSTLGQYGLVTKRKEGKQVFCSANRDRLVECCGMLMAKFAVEVPVEWEV